MSLDLNQKQSAILFRPHIFIGDFVCLILQSKGEKKMKKHSFLLGLLLGIVTLLGWQLSAQEESKKGEVILIVPSQMCQHIELNGVKSGLTKAGYDVKVASSKATAANVMNQPIDVDMTLDKVRQAMRSALAVVFIGGPGTTEYFNNKEAHAIAKQTLKQKKVLGAICLAPNILANAGVLKGVKATCYASFSQANSKAGIKVDQADVVVDRRIVTGNGPGATAEFTEKLIEELKKSPGKSSKKSKSSRTKRK